MPNAGNDFWESIFRYLTGGIDLGLEKAGMVCKWQCENNKKCLMVLNRHWQQVKKYGDIRENFKNFTAIDLIAGGDPCPIRSRARSNGKSKHPDLSGYFLAVVGRLWPRWVVRENVPAPDDKDFAACLELLGYRTIIIRTDAATFTGQRRIRDIIIGSTQKAWGSIAAKLYEPCNNKRYYSSGLKEKPYIPCLTTHRTRYDSRDCYIFDNRFRILDGNERTAFAGFPEGWLTGMSESAIARMTGNSVVPQISEMIGKLILHAERECNQP